MSNDSDSPTKNIENYLITADIGLLAAIAIIFSGQVSSSIATVLVAFSASFFVLSLLLSLWHLHRDSLRKKLFEKKKNEWLEKGKGIVEEMMTQAYSQGEKEAKIYIYENKEQLEGKTVEEVKKILDKEFPPDEYTKKNEKTLEILSESLAKDAQTIYRDAYLKPLEESQKTIKFFLDLGARKLRHTFFVLAFLCFLGAVISSSLPG